jgi:ssDNA-binding Zn-finger/Zn-ribbon topoisomerase 1
MIYTYDSNIAVALRSLKYKDRVEIACSVCGKPFITTKVRIMHSFWKDASYIVCSRKCGDSKQYTSITLPCGQCGKSTTRTLKEFKKSKSGFIFCSRSCNAIYGNSHKTTGIRRSKLEVYLEEQLSKLYSFEFHFNRKDTINAELDIYIPSLKLAFELNGIFHYESIFGDKKLSQTQNNDNRKFQACLEQGIELCIIDTSGQSYFKVSTSQKYLDIITNIIDSKLKW